MNPAYYKDTGLLNTQIQEITFSQEAPINEKRWTAIENTLSKFPKRDQSIFRMAYLSDKRKTCREISTEHNISPQRVSQIQRKILKHLKRKLTDLNIDL